METERAWAPDLRTLENPVGAAVPGGAALGRVEREARTRRLMIVGAMASFVTFFGLAAAGDIAAAFASPPATSAQVGAASGSSNALNGVASRSPAAGQPAAAVTAPAAVRSTHGRTASS